jgi:hypothetical protein
MALAAALNLTTRNGYQVLGLQENQQVAQN